MTIDTYTKSILTIIAMALIALCFQNSIRDAVANNGYQKVIICDGSGFCADIQGSSSALRVFSTN